MSKHKSERATTSARPCAEERRDGASQLSGVNSRTNDAAGRDQQAQQFFERVSKDRQQSLQFLRKAGILDGSGNLTKPYRD